MYKYQAYVVYVFATYTTQVLYKGFCVIKGNTFSHYVKLNLVDSYIRIARDNSMMTINIKNKFYRM